MINAQITIFSFFFIKLKFELKFKCSTSFDCDFADVDAVDVQHMSRSLMVADGVVDASQARCCAILAPARDVALAIEVLRLSLARIAIAVDYFDGDDCCRMAFHCVGIDYSSLARCCWMQRRPQLDLLRASKQPQLDFLAAPLHAECDDDAVAHADSFVDADSSMAIVDCHSTLVDFVALPPLSLK